MVVFCQFHSHQPVKKTRMQLLDASGVLAIPGWQALQTFRFPGHSDDGTSHAGLHEAPVL